MEGAEVLCVRGHSVCLHAWARAHSVWDIWAYISPAPALAADLASLAYRKPAKVQQTCHWMPTSMHMTCDASSLPSAPLLMS